MNMNVTSVVQAPPENRDLSTLTFVRPRQLKSPNSTSTDMVSQGHFEFETRLADVAHQARQQNYFGPTHLNKREWTSLQRKLARDEFRNLGYKDGEMVEWAGLIASNQDFDFYTRLQGLLFIETLVSNRPPKAGPYADIRGMYDLPNPDAIEPAIEMLTYIASMQVGDDKIRDEAIMMLGDEILYPSTARTIGVALYSVIDAMQDSPSAMHWVAYAAQNIGGAEGCYILDKMSKMDCLNGDDRTSRLTRSLIRSLIRAGLHNLKTDMLDYYQWPRGADGLSIIPDMSIDQFLSMDPGRFVPRIDVDFKVIKIGRIMAKGDPTYEKPPKSRSLPIHPVFLPEIPQLQEQ